MTTAKHPDDMTASLRPAAPSEEAFFALLESLEGQVESIVYEDASPFFVARVRVGSKRKTVTGEQESPKVGERYQFWGTLFEHPTYGPQLQAHFYEVQLPTSTKAIEAYLASGTVKGVGKTLAHRLVEHFGEQTLEVIAAHPERLAEVPRLRPEVRARLAESIAQHQAARRVLLFLASYGITPGLGNRIYRAFGAATIDVVQRTPYRLVEEVTGVGFRTADRVARQLGRKEQDPTRVEAGLIHTLREAQEDGHLFLPCDELLQKAASLLELDPALLQEGLERATIGGSLIEEEGGCYLPGLFQLEVRIARLVAQRLQLEGLPAPSPTEMSAIETSLGGLELAEQQRECLRHSLSTGVFIITGGPGTGKTTTLRGLLHRCRLLGLRVALAAPTGRAARRMTEATGEEARTLHRLLEYSPSERTFRRRRDNTLDLDVLVVDEASMVDAWLFRGLLEAIPERARLVLVGDMHQLPSVGAGSILRDLLDCGVVPKVSLDEIFRQAQDSYIVRNAHRIHRGELPEKGPASGDFFFIEEDSPERVAETILGLCTQRLPAYYGFSAVADIQVLAPMYKGSAGVDALNLRLQASLNPVRAGEPELTVSNGRARLGDKVMQIRNNYERGVFNGDMGLVEAFDEAKDRVWIRLLGSAPPRGQASPNEIHAPSGSEMLDQKGARLSQTDATVQSGPASTTEFADLSPQQQEDSGACSPLGLARPRGEAPLPPLPPPSQPLQDSLDPSKHESLQPETPPTQAPEFLALPENQQTENEHNENEQNELPGFEALDDPSLLSGLVEYGLEDGHELTLAYACSVHKSQGSEFPAVILPLVNQHFVMLARNLLYTAVTRARRLVVLVGSRKALATAIANVSVDKRYTRLASRVRKESCQATETFLLETGP